MKVRVTIFNDFLSTYLIFISIKYIIKYIFITVLYT